MATSGKWDSIGGTSDSGRPSIEDVRVDHRGSYVAMPEKRLNRANVMSVLEKMRSEGMSERMACHAFRDPGRESRNSYRSLQDRLVEMMTTHFTGR
jgi:hypothetical protein